MTSPVEAAFEEDRVRAVNFITSEKLPTLFVEGGLDRYILNHHFGKITRVVIPETGSFGSRDYRKGGKSLVRKKVESNGNSFGFVDMDHDFRSSFVRTNPRLEDSSPKSCLASLMVDDTSTREFVASMLRKRGLASKNDSDNVLNMAKAHSIVVWERGMTWEKGDKIPDFDEEDVWGRLLLSSGIEEFSESLQKLPNGTGLGLFWRVNKSFLENAGMRDHSLVEAILRYVEFRDSSTWMNGTSEIQRKLAGFIKYRPLHKKLERFHESIQMQTL